jgi:hypothetical protein
LDGGKIYKDKISMLVRMQHVVEKVKGFLMKPSETFQATKSDSLTSAFQYYVILLIIFSILYAIVSTVIGVAMFNSYINQLASSGLLGSYASGLLQAFAPFVTALTLFWAYFIFLFSLFGIFLDGFMYHVFVILFGGEKGLTQTVKTVMYAWTPFFLLGWIPYVSIIGLIWAWILIIIGVKETQEMVLGKAILVLIVPLILFFILFVAGIGVVVSFLAAMANILPKPF